MVLITATYKQERADTVMLVYSSHEKTQLMEAKVAPNGEMESPSLALELPRPPRRSRVTRLRFWPTDSFLLLGYSNGVFRIMDIRSQTTVSTWSQGLNDPATGDVTDIHPLEGNMVTSGKDGTLFTHKLAGAIFECAERVEMEQEQKQRLEEGERPAWKSLGEKVGVPEVVEVDTSKWDNVHDIEDPNHLCLEDMRLKEGEEKTNKLMEDKMLRIQKDISNLKRDFKKIQQRNENLHREYQVPKEKFQMTDFTYKLIQEEIEAKMKEVVKSREAETEESKKVLENIRKRFFDPIQFNRVVVKGLKSKQELTTFRIAKMKASDGKGEQAVDSIMVEHESPDSWTPRTPRAPGKIGDQSSGGDESSEGNSLCVNMRNPKQRFILRTWSANLSFKWSGCICFTRKDRGQDSQRAGEESQRPIYKKETLHVRMSLFKVAKALAKQEAKREKKMARKKEWDELYYRSAIYPYHLNKNLNTSYYNPGNQKRARRTQP